MTFPQSAYAEAVHTAFADAGIPPSTTVVSVEEVRFAFTDHVAHELTITLTWEGGLQFVWHPNRSWYFKRPDRGDKDLRLPELVAPAELIAPVRAALAGKPGCDLPLRVELWEHHSELDRHIAEWEERL